MTVIGFAGSVFSIPNIGDLGSKSL
jgi:hypothetical protein